MSHMNFFGSPVRMEVIFTPFCSLLSVQNILCKKAMYIPELENTLLLKNANHHLSLQRVLAGISKITDHR